MTVLSPFMSERRQLDLATADALNAQFGGRGVTLPGDYTAVLTADIHVPLYGTFPAGTRCEVSGDTVRLSGGRLVLTSAESGGVMRPALSLVERYVPPMVAMVRSPYTDQLVPAESGTARRVLGK